MTRQWIDGSPGSTFARPVRRPGFVFGNFKSHGPKPLGDGFPAKLGARARAPGAIYLFDKRRFAPTADHGLAFGPHARHELCLTPFKCFTRKSLRQVLNSVKHPRVGKEGRNSRREGLRRANCVFIGAWVSAPLANAVDDTVRTMGLDRSKLLRLALEEKVKKESG